MEKVLVIDDSVSVRIALERILRQRPVEVVTASNGEDGLAAILGQRPSLVICDLILPDRDGLSIVRHVRAHPEVGTTPVFLISGAGDAGLEKEAREAGCDAILRKPFTPDGVLSLLDRFLAGSLRPASLPARTAGPSAEFAAVAPAPPQILVIDDSLSVRVAIDRLLSRRGYQTVAAATAAEAMYWLERTAIDLVISDLVMPDRDGTDLVRQLRADPRFRHLPVILVSGMEDREIEEKGRLAGADEVVQKPFTAESLLPKVERLLERSRLTSKPESGDGGKEARRQAVRPALKWIRGVAGVEWAALASASSGELIDAVGTDPDATAEPLRRLSPLVTSLQELGGLCGHRPLQSAICRFGSGLLLVFVASDGEALLVSLSSAHQLGLVTFLVEKKLPALFQRDEAGP